MFESILVPIDLSPISETTFQAGMELARESGAKLHPIHVLPDYGYSIVARYFPAMPGIRPRQRR